ncbi:MAG: ABC transporter substrate-binding protein [Eubacteriales bacterium]|nr:ABC transporter substrate-binding protein [Eubacteriales bacterium]
MKKNLILALAMGLALNLAACGQTAANEAQTQAETQITVETETQAQTQTETQSEAETQTQTAEAAAQGEKPGQDRAGNSIQVPEQTDRIISLMPASTQILADLGLKDNIIAVDTQSPSYEDFSDDVLQFDMMEPDLEQLIASEPDVIFVSNLSSQGGEDIFASVREAGICVAEIPTSDTIEDVKLDVQFVADCVGKSAEGAALVDQMEEEIAAVKAIGDTITEKKTVLFEISPLPYLYSFGRGVYLNEMIELIGAQNVLADQEGWLSVTEESAVASNPDVILTNDNFSGVDAVEQILARPGWENVTAVANRQVYYIDNGASSLPNHHIVDALREMAKAVYPDEFAGLE